MRTITLELVRHGPPHNQLLSPLTQYLALCENHPAVTLQLPVEHNQMLYRLRALAYGMGPAPREFQLRDTAQLIGDLLARVPGLTADMNRRDGGAEGSAGQGADDDIATHLRLVLSASELALLPFELGGSAGWLPGSRQPAAAAVGQARDDHPRDSPRRRAAVVWPDKTRVLFVTASPAGCQAPPAAAHLLALRRALEPWIGTRGRRHFRRQAWRPTREEPDSADRRHAGVHRDRLRGGKLHARAHPGSRRRVHRGLRHALRIGAAQHGAGQAATS